MLNTAKEIEITPEMIAAGRRVFWSIYDLELGGFEDAITAAFRAMGGAAGPNRPPGMRSPTGAEPRPAGSLLVELQWLLLVPIWSSCSLTKYLTGGAAEICVSKRCCREKNTTGFAEPKIIREFGSE
ncbi:MAG TPA: hypothetical protein VHY79_04765 [Rhizomicrobium sp.]|jgi:hypothetical protein|nr:hypothetical protein [Rhizomicrobium sp.]